MGATFVDEGARLLRSVAHADQTSLAALYDLYGRRILLYAQSWVHDRWLAEEIVVDTMMAVWQGAANFDGASRASTWILGITRHKSIDALRRRRNAARDPVSIESEAVSEAPGPEEQLTQAAARRQMLAALDQLTPEHREVLWLAFFDDMPYPDIAQLLSVPVNTVKTRVYYAKQKLRSLLEPSTSEGGAT